MPDYVKGGTGNPIVKDGDTEHFTDAAKTVPGPKSQLWNDRLNAPLRCTLTKTPNYVIITSDFSSDGKLGLFFGNSASFATKATAEGFKIGALNGGGGLPTGSLTSSQHYMEWGGEGVVKGATTIPVHPIAWSGSAADQGKVVFVYQGGPDGSGRP